MNERLGKREQIKEELRSSLCRVHDSAYSKAELRRHGIYTWSDQVPEVCHVVIQDLESADLPAFTDDLHAYYDHVDVAYLFIDDRQHEEKIREPLLASGHQRRNDWIYVLHNGILPQIKEIEDVTIEQGSAETELENHTVKIQGFRNSEDAPTQQELESEFRFHRAEMAQNVKHRLARWRGEAVEVYSKVVDEHLSTKRAYPYF